MVGICRKICKCSW